MHIKRATLKDGRYLIYYTFDGPRADGDDEPASRDPARVSAEATEEAALSPPAESAPPGDPAHAPPGVPAAPPSAREGEGRDV